MKSNNSPANSMTVSIESLDQDGRGIAHHDGKVIFIEGALIGEHVSYQSYRKKPHYEFARVDQVFRHSAIRTEPGCKHFQICGGCAMQHLEHTAQVAVKQRVLEDNLARIGKVKPEQILPPLYGAPWGYRKRARLSARFVQKKGRELVGFHEKHSSFVADLDSCDILPPHVSALIVPVRELIEKLSIRERLPQIELAVGDAVTVLVLRILEPLDSNDEILLKAFADRHDIQFWLQTKGPETVKPFYPLDAPPLYYTIPAFNIVMPYSPIEFTQVNSDINQILISRAIDLLNPQPDEKIADLFCGIGNFSLPLARRAARVVGVEGSEAMVKRATKNALRNSLDGTTNFVVADLFKATEQSMAALGHFDKMLIDPPRDGAVEVVKALGEHAPRSIVYVSCNPATLARDAAVLVNTKGYQLRAAGVINMFPHTAHVESMALFEHA
ncbi:MAG: 23S rRNA (uracil(1939)-C(5))-methyltransferase RlmD [Burkholderiales bacterium]